ncbi:N-acetylmuramoyl-L-alanine amidase [Teredinibacter purpureus]|jgi:Negative regulator of beta-lactamase expression|uniref:N-acetylmuramoyl-L-alanine amidase n=1 Tax=Teredinibacter purpureus TaxID=2731756 RepID=UPI0006964560|nr:N-acetylmuramoyl-L-alanine amidase [Teredinibacter purpureus]
MSTETKALSLDQWRLAITFIASIIIPTVIFFTGQSIEKTLKDRELALKYVEISVDILTEEARPETQNLRAWAIQNINAHAAVKLDDNTIDELKSETMPTATPAITHTTGETSNFTIPVAPRDIRYIIITDSETPSMRALKNMMVKPKAEASYHYIIGVDGTVEKMIEEHNIAWHAGRSQWNGEHDLNAVSIGIGLVHLSSADGDNWMRLASDHPAVGPHYPHAQLDALTNLLGLLAKRYALAPENIITKQAIAPDRSRTDLYGAPMAAIRATLRP